MFPTVLHDLLSWHPRWTFEIAYLGMLEPGGYQRKGATRWMPVGMHFRRRSTARRMASNFSLAAYQCGDVVITRVQSTGRHREQQPILTPGSVLGVEREAVMSPGAGGRGQGMGGRTEE